MDIVKNAKDLGSEIEHGVEAGISKGKEVLSNVASHLPFANLARKDDYNFSIEIDLPGVRKEDVEVKVDGNKLHVSAVRKMKSEVQEEDYYVHESFYGKIARSFVLPEDVDKENIDAKLEDGRLYISMKKVESRQPKQVKIK